MITPAALGKLRTSLSDSQRVSARPLSAHRAPKVESSDADSVSATTRRVHVDTAGELTTYQDFASARI
jgi:hypothetical protein